VVTLGTTAMQGDVETRFEVYKPWYMQPGSPARPTITTVATTLRLGNTYPVTFSGPAAVTGASLQRLTSVTHSSDPNQRAVDVPVTATTNWNQKSLKIEANRAILPPGMYMLTLRDWRNIPSKSVIVRVIEDSVRTASTAPGGPWAAVPVQAGGASATGPVPTVEASSASCCCDCGSGCC
jgi:hypothetical protein